MPEQVLEVRGRVDHGIAVLTMTYGSEQMLKQGSFSRLSEQLLNAYKAVRQQSAADLSTRSCVVELQVETAGSPLVRALFELYKEVNSGGGQVICTGYPADYIDSLTTMGLPSLPGFSLTATTQEAIDRLTQS